MQEVGQKVLNPFDFTCYTFLGGSSSDYAEYVIETSDGGLLVAGLANANIPSLSGKTPLNLYSAGRDMLVVKLKGNGEF